MFTISDNLQISLVGAIFLLTGLGTWLFIPRYFVVILASSSAFFTTSAIDINGNSVAPFYLLGILATISALGGWFDKQFVNQLSLKLLGLLLTWSIFISIIGPLLFSGTLILNPRGGIDSQILNPTPLSFTPSIAAQNIYLLIAIGVVWFISQQKDLSPRLLEPAFVLGNLLSALYLFPGLKGSWSYLFRNFASAGYNIFEKRHPGIYAEPSMLAMFAISAIIFSVLRLKYASLKEKWLLFIITGTATLNLILSGSSTAILSFVIIGALVVAYRLTTFLTGRIFIRPIELFLYFVVIFVIAIPTPIADRLWQWISNKSGTQSFSNRSNSDFFSMDIFLNTYGLGVGLGANRPSSFITMLFSNVGIIGFVVLTLSLLIAIYKVKQDEWLPVTAALLGLLLAKAIAVPEMSTPLLWLELGCCIWAGKAISSQKDAGSSDLHISDINTNEVIGNQLFLKRTYKVTQVL